MIRANTAHDVGRERCKAAAQRRIYAYDGGDAGHLVEALSGRAQRHTVVNIGLRYDKETARFGVPVGLSDHSMGIAVPIAAVALGACIIEKHLTLSRSVKGPDSEFSLEPHEFKAMVEAVRTVEQAIGRPEFRVGEKEKATRAFRRSLFVVEDVKVGDVFTAQNVRSIRPGNGLHTRHLAEIIGQRASCDIQRGTPLRWELVAGK